MLTLNAEIQCSIISLICVLSSVSSTPNLLATSDANNALISSAVLDRASMTPSSRIATKSSPSVLGSDYILFSTAMTMYWIIAIAQFALITEYFLALHLDTAFRSCL